jgi:hypothetical protein
MAQKVVDMQRIANSVALNTGGVNIASLSFSLDGEDCKVRLQFDAGDRTRVKSWCLRINDPTKTFLDVGLDFVQTLVQSKGDIPVSVLNLLAVWTVDPSQSMAEV